jgi:hypothetical protein
MAMVQELSTSELDELCHHFTEELANKGVGHSSWQLVQDSQEKLRAVKSKVITEMMNVSDYRTALGGEKTFNPAGIPGPIKGIGSLVVASLADLSSVSNNSTIGSMTQKAPVYLKVPVSLNGIKHVIGVVPELLKALLNRDNVWQGGESLRQAVYDVVYSAESIPSLSEWKLGPGGNNISVCTASGLRLECALLHNDESNMAANESDQTFSRRMMCQRVTRTYSAQPIVITAQSTTAISRLLRACVYPCSNKPSGILMATTHLSGFERPLRSCAIVVPCALRRHASFGVHEADVSALITPYARTHVRTLAEMFSKCAVMRTVLGTKTPVFTTSRLGDMDELELHKQYTHLRGMCTHTQLRSCANIWEDVDRSHAMNLTCISGTINAFENDDFHTDVAMHTHSMMDTTFMYGGEEFKVNSPLVVSMYGTYYHHMGV